MGGVIILRENPLWGEVGSNTQVESYLGGY